jgi:Tfp pilus assembly PilM family ATPase
MLKRGIIDRRKTSVITLDPYSLKSYRYRDNVITEESVKKSDDRAFYISYVQTKDIISSTVDIEIGVSDEELDDAIEIKAYDELGLEAEREYSIFHFQSNRNDGEFRVFNVIAIDTDVLNQIFSELKDIKYIDYITAAPFLMKSLYEKNLLVPDKTDCFVYFHKDDAHVTIYKNGEYVFSKSIKYSLGYIADTFAKELGKRIDEKTFFSMLKKNGMQHENSAYQQQLMKIFGELFVYVNDVILYAKRAYRLENIDQVYIGTEIGNIAGLEEFCYNYISLPTKYLNFKISKNANEVDVEPLHTMMIETAHSYLSTRDDTYNISIFKKPPPLKERPSGKLMQVITVSLLLSLAYPGYQFVYERMFLQKELTQLRQQHQNLSQRSKQIKTALAQVQKEKKEIDAKLAVKMKDLDFRTNLLKEIYKKKVNYPMKAKIMTDLFRKVNAHHSKVVETEEHNNTMYITVRSPKDKYITELIQDISLRKDYDVSTDLIKKDDNNSYYESSIKVGLNGQFN